MQSKKVISRICAAAVILTLATTSLLSGTMAKYTGQVAATDTARVARFDCRVYQNEAADKDAVLAQQFTANTKIPKIDLFGTTTNDTGIFGTKDIADEGTKKSSKLVGPGMEGYFSFLIANQSEVAIEAKMEELGYVNDYGLPLVFFFNGGYYSDFTDSFADEYESYNFYRHEGDAAGVKLIGNMSDLLDAINSYKTMDADAAQAKVGGVERTAAGFAKASNGTLTEDSSSEIKINWFWAYEVSQDMVQPDDSVLISEKTILDGSDTFLGEMAMGIKIPVSMTPKVSYSQIDTFTRANIKTNSLPADKAQTWADGYTPNYIANPLA